ncbi:hypothetical protein [Treponema ruminis]|uniref:Ribosomal protein S3 n=2 Tax=Treponema TaxID=157 RepID=A0A7W8LNH9_9SPIR|nr:hypothetical protein [Treponema ruminis]MBB5227418.1 ribosomal protein S3 [Treponema ruminis]
MGGSKDADGARGEPGSMRGAEYLRLAARLEREAARIKYGTVGVTVQIHDGEVCKIRWQRQECEAFEVGKGKEKKKE